MTTPTPLTVDDDPVVRRRSDRMTQVAPAVGEGPMSVHLVHRHLATT